MSKVVFHIYSSENSFHTTKKETQTETMAFLASPSRTCP